jgi:hypothetical protein
VETFLRISVLLVTGGHSSTCLKSNFQSFDVFKTTITTTDACIESQDIRVYISESSYAYFISFESREARFMNFLLGSEAESLGKEVPIRFSALLRKP